MTEEEKLAEEYVREIKAIANDSKARIDKIVDRVKEEYAEEYTKENAYTHSQEAIRQAFLAGYKKGQEETAREMTAKAGADIVNLTLELKEFKDVLDEVYKGLDKLYLSGLTEKQIAFVEQLQDKCEKLLGGEE